MSPAQQLRADVVAMHRPGDTLTFASDAHSNPESVLLAIWRPAGVFVMTVARSEWDGLATAKIFGFEHQAPTAMERATTAPVTTKRRKR